MRRKAGARRAAAAGNRHKRAAAVQSSVVHVGETQSQVKQSEPPWRACSAWRESAPPAHHGATVTGYLFVFEHVRRYSPLGRLYTAAFRARVMPRWLVHATSTVEPLPHTPHMHAYSECKLGCARNPAGLAKHAGKHAGARISACRPSCSLRVHRRMLLLLLLSTACADAVSPRRIASASAW